MPATLSPEFQIAAILDGIGCPPSNFSDIVGRCSTSRMLAALKGANDFNTEDGQFYLDFARQMKKLARDYPVPIAWKETLKIREILAASRTAMRPIPFAVVMIGSKLFKQVVSGRVETVADYQSCAAFQSPLIANAAMKVLDQMGERDLRTTTITNQVRAPETIFSNLSKFGFTH